MQGNEESTGPRERLVRLGLLLGSLTIALTAPVTARATIQASLEAPSALASGVSNIQGWAFTTVAGASINTLIQVSIDDTPSVRVPCCSDRGDVQAVFPAAPLNSGFSGVFNWGLLQPGPHEIAVTITSTAGESATITRQIESNRFISTPFFTNLQFAEDALCFPENEPIPPGSGQVLAGPVVFTAPGGAKTTCVGPTPGTEIMLLWDTASQSFKLTPSICTE